MQFLDLTGLATFLAKLKTIFLGVNDTAASAKTLGSDTVGGGANPIYLNAGVATASTETVGSETKPVYMADGVITETGDSLAVSVTGTASETQTALDEHIADTNNPHNVTAAQLGLASAYKYKGSVDSYADLPTDAEEGDVYNIATADDDNGIKAGDNVAWTGSAWDNLSGTVDTSALEELITEKAPIYHASTSTDYGVGSDTLYGHVMLSDSVSADYTAENGVAATPAAVQAAIDSAISEIDVSAISDEDIEALFA